MQGRFFQNSLQNVRTYTSPILSNRPGRRSPTHGPSRSTPVGTKISTSSLRNRVFRRSARRRQCARNLVHGLSVPMPFSGWNPRRKLKITGTGLAFTIETGYVDDAIFYRGMCFFEFSSRSLTGHGTRRAAVRGPV